MLAMSAVIGQTVLGEVISATDDSQMDQEILQQASAAIGIFDIGVVVFNASFYLAAIILGSRIKTSKVFALPAVLFLGIGVWLSSEVANIYYRFGQVEAISSYAAEFTLVQQFMANLPVITLGLGSLLIVVFFTGIGNTQEVTV
jgi:hypothetical protein